MLLSHKNVTWRGFKCTFVFDLKQDLAQSLSSIAAIMQMMQFDYAFIVELINETGCLPSTRISSYNFILMTHV